MVLVQKWPFFQFLFFRKYRPRKCLLRYSRTKKTPFQAIKTISSKTQNLTFFQLFFLRKYRPVKCLLRVLERKKAFLGYKHKKLKTRKIDIFPKGLTHGFGTKMAIFPTFISQKIFARKMSITIFQNEKTPFQATKKRSVQKLEKLTFFQNG